MKKSRRKLQQFKVLAYISQGSYGLVQKCISLKNDKAYALKSIQNIREHELQYIKKEVLAMEKCRSNYTLQLVDHFYDEDDMSYIIVFPFFELGSLQNDINRDWSQPQILLFLYQIAQGFLDISASNIWHLDLKPENILRKSSCEYLICDFGCARHLDNATCSIKLAVSSFGVGTPEYASPELVLSNDVSKYTDVWSLGIILYKILYKKHPLIIQNFNQIFSAITQFSKGSRIIQYEHLEGHQDTVEICQQMLRLHVEGANNKRINWAKLMCMVYDSIKVDPEMPIITQLDDLIDFTNNVSIVLSGLIYYIDLRFEDCMDLQNSRLFKIQKQIKASALRKHIYTYLALFTQIISLKIKGNLQLKRQVLFIFSETIKHKSQQTTKKLLALQKQVKRFIISMDLQLQCQSLPEAYTGLMNHLKQFDTRIMPFHEELAIDVVKQWHKVQVITKAIINNNVLQYAKAQQLSKLSYHIVYM